mgnify:CR=1 FL=1
MLKPKKSLGQNFLIDKNIISKIISLTNIKNKSVAEIGPGTGNLTKAIIANKPSSLILVEKDKNLSSELELNLNYFKKIKLFNSDILKFDFNDRLEKETIIFGNLPYNISTQILVNMIKCRKWPPNYSKLIFMFQKEVAEKIIAKNNTSNYGRLSIISSYRLEVVEYFDISKNCFFPKPKVNSTVIVFKPKIINNIHIKNIDNLEKVKNIFFSFKRKMINKALAKLFIDYKLIAKRLNIDLSSRPAELNEELYYKLAKYYEEQNLIKL